MSASTGMEFDLTGEIGRRLEAVIGQWAIPAPAANPTMLAMYRDRDITPYRQMVPWAGEFAGKYLTHCVQLLRLTEDAELRGHLKSFVEELLACQAPDGYLGCWPEEFRMLNNAPNPKQLTWDSWAHYHAMLGLLLWEEISGDEKALKAAERIADLLCKLYLGEGKPRLVDTGSTEMNLAPIHSLCMLYKRTGEARHLAMAKQILAEFAAKGKDGESLAGDYLESTLSGKEFHETPKPRWESLHPIMGLPEMHYITGDGRCRQAFENLWWSMLRGDRHNNGGFSSGEQATGNPYDKGAIETCCTVAWMAMSVEMLRLTGLSVVADELELSLFNSGLGLMSASGRWVTYDTPMDGIREASAHRIVFQSRAGSPELNCCSVNGPRALGLLCEWALTQNTKGLALNYYGPGEMSMPLPSGNKVTLRQETDYPRKPTVDIIVSPSKKEHFAIAIRIPYWSRNTQVWIDGEKASGVKAGSYFEIERDWAGQSRIRIEMDFQLQFWRHPDPTYLGSESKDWEIAWTVAGPIFNKGKTPAGIASDALALDRATCMQDVLKSKGVLSTESKRGQIDFKSIFRDAPMHSAAYCFCEFEASSDGILMLYTGCDWWYSCFVNGQEIEAKPNAGLIDMRCNFIRLPLKAGRNLIGLRITGGSDGWRLTLGKGSFIPSGAKEMQAIFASVYRGPILLTYDMRFNDTKSAFSAPALAKPELELLLKWEKVPSDNPWILMEGKDTNGKAVRYCDFASAGAGGNYYRSWVQLAFECPQTEFSRENPRRSSPA